MADVIGRFDPELFARMRAAAPGTAVRRILLERLMIQNEPLTKTLVAQLLGKGERRPGMRHRLGRMPGSDLLEWEDAMQAGRMGMMKALENLDLAQGKLSYYALRKIHYELQCVLAKTAVVRVERGQEGQVSAVFASTYEDDGYFDTLVHDNAVEEHGEAVSHGDLVLAQLEAERQAVRDAEPAVASFVRDRLAFGRALRVARMTLLSAFERHVRLRRGNYALSALRVVLRERGVRPMSVWAPWAGRTVTGFGGVGLGNAAPEGQ